MKNKILLSLHNNGQKFARRAHAADRNGNRISSLVNIKLFILCYNLRDLLRNN